MIKLLAEKYIQIIIANAKQALEKLDKGDHEVTKLDIQQALGLLDLETDLEAAKILLREELKERRLGE